jgi:hypothetical protein
MEAQAKPPKLLDQLREAIRMRHYSVRTEEAYHDGGGVSFCSTTSVIRARWGRRR